MTNGQFSTGWPVCRLISATVANSASREERKTFRVSVCAPRLALAGGLRQRDTIVAREGERGREGFVRAVRRAARPVASCPATRLSSAAGLILAPPIFTEAIVSTARTRASAADGARSHALFPLISSPRSRGLPRRRR